MSLPVSQYEALLAEVRALRRKTQRVQQLARPLIGYTQFQNDIPLDYTMDSLLLNRQHDRSDSPNYDRGTTCGHEHGSSDDEFRLGIPRDRSSRSTGQMSVSSEPVTRVTGGPKHIESMYHGAWPNVERTTMWNSEPTSLGESGTRQLRKEFNACSIASQNEVSSVMSFASSSGGVPIERVLCSPEQKWSSQQLEAKMDVVNSLLSMLGSQEHVDMGETLLALSSCPESCLAMRQSGCIPLLVQLVQSDKDNDTQRQASQALHNLVNSQPDEKIRKREIRILKLLQDTRRYIECLKHNLEFKLEESGRASPSLSQEDGDNHPVQTIAHLMKLSFDEGHRQAICQLGGIHTIANLVETEHSKHGSTMQEGHCVLMRRYACMALTNLTFGDSGNKTLLCSFRDFMRALIIQLQSPSDELRQVTASVLRNLSWRADSTSKEILREVGTVTGLMKSAMLQNKENTLKSILSALWNLSAHCTENKSEICAVEGGLGFIVNMLTYKTPSKSLAIIENAGGILRNISSQIAVRDDYREILRKNNCLHILLDQLKSPSLTIVSNACGTLWNLSAKNAQDQDTLWQMGAPAMLRSLNHSKHKMIAMGSSAALKNLMNCRPQQNLLQTMDSTALSLNLPELPTLGARKQKALMQDLDNTLSETYENIDKDSPVKSSIESNVDIVNFIHGSRSRAKSRSPENLTNAFASLNLNEPSTSYAMDIRHKQKLGQNCGGSSLPYVPQPTRRSNPASFLPVRSKFSDHGYEGDTASEQPIDYSRKYFETAAVGQQRSGIKSENENDRKSNSSYADTKDSESFNMGYTETDLDQPTDYSLRYAEDDSDSEICVKMTKQEYIQDTVKTYCTEGTPYETPFVFSNATSMSDLRNVGNTDEKREINNDIQKNNDVKDNKEVKHVDEKDRCSTEDISELDNVPIIKPQKSELSSGMMSPEKPVNYCEEGTPGYFSRVSSFESGLDSIPANETVIKKEVKEEVNLDESSSSSVQKIEKDNTSDKITSTPKTPNETKVVKFEQVVNYAEQTPLMFSRSSSLASLDSIEQHSIHDDRSSVVSDFSRLTSGIVSPSELPDSPTQTVPTSPRSSKPKLDFPSSSRQSRHSIENKQRHQQKSCVFEDNTTKFKEESTPIQFSTATSLSSLTIDDHKDDDNSDSPAKTPDTKVLQPQANVSSSSNIEQYDQQGDQQEKKDTEKEKETSGSDDLNDDSEGDEDILAACISDGMQSNISVPTASSTPTKLPMSTFKYQPTTKMQGNGSGIPMIRRSPPRHIPLRNPNLNEDPTRTYFTEDTPAELSRAGSNSNLSNLSIPTDNKSKVGDSSDDSSNLSGDNDLLEACIQSAMPKSKQDMKATALQLKLPTISVVPRRTIQPFKNHPTQMHSASSIAQKPNETLKMSQPYNNYKEKPLEKIDGGHSRRKGSNDGQGTTRLMKNRRETSLPPYLSMRDELSNYEVEDSPCHFSLRSSLSDLTVDGSVAGLKPFTKSQNPVVKEEPKAVGASGKAISADNSNSSADSQVTKAAHRKLSFSSLSSLTSNEGDQALLEECIYSGMPTDRQEEALLNECIQAGMPTSRSGSINVYQGTSNRPVPNTLRPFQRDDFLVQSQNTVSEGSNGSKNVNVASVAGSTVVIRPPVSEQRPEMSTTVAGVENGPALGQSDKNVREKFDSSVQVATVQESQGPQRELVNASIGTPPAIDTLPARSLHSDENLLTDQTKSGSSKSVSQFLEGSFENDFTYSNSDNCVNLEHAFTKSCEESGNLVDNRMLDPDAMIESLDRFTAELVSQASQLNKEKGSQPDKQEKSKVSNNDDITWNDDTSHNELTFPTMSGSAPNIITFGSEQDESCSIDVVDAVENPDEGISNDFSSLNTNTMTESTLIAIEAVKMASVFKIEAEMSQSTMSTKSLDLDSVMPPSQIDALTNSMTGLFEKGVPRSPKLISRKKSLPGSLLVKRALSNSLNHASSLESLDNNSISYIECLNPPSEMQHLGDLDSITSIASLPREESDVQPPEFAINGVTRKTDQDCRPHPIFNVKQQFIPSDLNSFTADLELVNPPSIFNDITDMCNSLADVATEAIGTETSIFEDCFTHLADNTYVDNTLQNDMTEFSDANSLTPIQTDFSSAESTPKRTGKPLSKNMMTKQRRNIARDRYKTYVVAAEKVMQESIELETKERLGESNLDDNDEPLSDDDYKTVNDKTETLDSSSEVQATYTATKTSKLTPKEKRRMNRSRFETQVLDESSFLRKTDDINVQTERITECRSNSASPSPTRSKLSIRRNFMQKRLENKERFRTQTLSESSFGSPEISSASPPCDNTDIHSLVEKEANLVLKNIRDSKLLNDDMLDCETLSLVSNDEDSEHNSGSSINYRTYHRSWSSRKHDIPVVSAETNDLRVEEVATPPIAEVMSSGNSVTEDHSPVIIVQKREVASFDSLVGCSESNSDQENPKETSLIGKPKIVKPLSPEPPSASEDVENEEQPKGIRGRRKPLYSKTNLNNKVATKTIKPAKTMASNLVKNITSSIKSGTSLKNVVKTREKSISSRPPVPSQVKSSGYGFTRNSNTAATTPNKSVVNSRNNSPKNSPKHTAKGTPPMERQGTFTKDDLPSGSSPKTPTKLPMPPSKIPSFPRQIARAVTSKIPFNNNTTPTRLNMFNGPSKSASADRTNKNTRMYNRSTSADSREPSKPMQPSSSTPSLKHELKPSNGVVRKSGIPSPAQRSKSNVSIPSNGGVKKQVTSKIASLWKKVEDTKARQFPCQDKRVWIQAEKTSPPKLIRSNTFENKDDETAPPVGENGIRPEPNSIPVIPSVNEG